MAISTLRLTAAEREELIHLEREQRTLSIEGLPGMAKNKVQRLVALQGKSCMQTNQENRGVN